MKKLLLILAMILAFSVQTEATRYKVTTEIDTDLKTGIVTGVEEITAPAPQPIPEPGPVVSSPDGTLIPPAIQIIDASLKIWTLGSAMGKYGYPIILDGTPTLTEAVNLLWAGGQFYCRNNRNTWYLWRTNRWSSVNPPIVLEPLPEPTSDPEVPPPTPEPTPPPEPLPPPPQGMIINDTNFYAVPDIPRPPKGIPYIDPVFHTEIVRITDSPTETGSTWANPGYPKHDIENCDGTRLIIQSRGGSGWHIYNALPPYNKIKDIPIALINRGVAIDARWDATDPNIIYFQRYGMRRYNVLTDECETLHVFSEDFPPRPGEEYPKFGQTLQEEGNSSDDSRYWAFNIYGQDKDPITGKVFYLSTAIAVYDKDFNGKNKGKIISILPKDKFPSTGVDAEYPLTNPGFVSISPSGKWVWTGDRARIFSADFDPAKYKNLGVSGHADMGFSREGREVVVSGARYYKGGADLGIWVTMVDLETGEKTYLAPVGDSHYHISGNGHLKPGWCVVSVYGPTAPAVPTMWAQHSVYLVEMSKRVPNPDLNNHARVWRIAHTHTKKVAYADDPFAKMNRKGTKVWFGSGWGESYQNGQYDVYQVNLPSTWYEDLK